MKKYILLLTFLLLCMLSFAQYDFLKESLIISSAPSYLVVKVKSPSYEGEAAILSTNFFYYYSSIVKKNLNIYKYKNTKIYKKFNRLAYRDIKRGKYFIISNEDFLAEYYNINQKYYVFKKIIVNDTVLDISKKGIAFFISTYFDDSGIFNPPQSYNSNDYYTIVKVLFDAGIRTGIGSEYSDYRIQDSRFYKKYVGGKAIDYVYPEKGKFVIPPEYRYRKE